MSEGLDLALRLNLAAAAAVLVVMLLRAPVRRLFGPRLAYGVWALVPLAVVAAAIPSRVVTLPAAPSPDIALFGVTAEAAPHVLAAAPAVHFAPPSDLTPMIVGVWLAGAAVALLVLWRSQALFDRAVRAGRAGPAVVGLVAPRIVTPDDFAAQYTPEEQRVVLAHEAAHIARQDPRINALMALARCLAWFNPLVHLMAHGVRMDQEFACDAAVAARYPRARRAYAQALLKTQLTVRPLPFGCHWAATHPLVTRVDLLARPRSDVMARAAGLVVVGALALGGATAVWAARPPRVVIAPSHEAIILDRAVRNAPPLRLAATPVAGAPAPATPSSARLSPIALAEAPAGPVLEPVAFHLSPEPGFAAAEPPAMRRIHGAADLSSIAPGAAVRAIATMIDPQGIELTTDLTAFGSQSLYRVGYVERGGSRMKLFTSVVQHGDRYRVTAALNGSFRPEISGSIDLASGESGDIRLPQGLVVSVHLIARPETPEEIAAARALGPRRFVSVEQFERSF